MKPRLVALSAVAIGRAAVDHPPVEQLEHQPGQAEGDDEAGRAADHAAERRDAGQQRHAGIAGQQQVARRHQRVVPLPDGLERGVDHGGAPDRHRRAHRRQQPGEGGEAGQVGQQRGAEADRRDIGDDRGDAFPRQPGGPPLAEGPPGPGGVAEMQHRGDEAGGDQQQRQHQADQGEGRGRRHHAERPQQPEPEQQPVARAGGGGEEDDRRRRVHRVRTLSIQRSSGFLMSIAVGTASCGVTATLLRLRGGRYLLTGL